MIDKDYISRLSIFSNFTQDQLEELAAEGELLQFNPGELVFDDGEEATRLFGVLSGEVELFMVAEEENLKTDVQHEEYARSEIETIKRDIAVDAVREKDIFGWSALTTSGKYTSKAVCSEPTRVLVFQASILKSFFMNNPEVGYPFMAQLVEVISDRLTNRTDKLIEGWSQAFKINRV